MIRSKDEVKMTYNQDGSFDMHFISSDIHIDRNHTARVIAPSCGDGKTTMIKYIMKHYFQYGILVAVDTIDEVKMYGEYIKNELIGYTSVNGFTLTDDDYILLHSKNENKQFEYTYASNPLDIMNKAIVVCTHHKFFNNDPRIFIHTNINVRNPEYLRKINMSSLSIFKQAVGGGPLSRGLSQVGSDGVRRRQFLLIDEMPKCNILKRKFSKLELSALVNREYIKHSDTKFHYEITNYNPDGSPIYKQVIDEWHDPIIKYSIESKDDLYYRYIESMKGGSNDDKWNTRTIDDINTMAMLDSLFDKFDYLTLDCKRNNDGYINKNGIPVPGTLRELPESIDVTYNLSNLADPDMQTNLWLFDGTGDLTFCNVKNFDISIPDINTPKFQSPINFYRVDISSGRRFKESTLYENHSRVMTILDDNINIILGVFRDNPNGKILIDSWKNFRFTGVNELEVKDYLYRDYITREGKTLLFDLPRYYSSKLNPIVDQMKSTGELGPNFEFSFIHYQSGLDRATNQFKDYDSIVFLGEFIVPQSAIDEHNLNMSSSTDIVKYTLHQLVQATCRLRVRKHTGEPINVYYTSDWNEKLMILLGLYMSNKPLSQKIDLSTRSGEYLMDDNYIRFVSTAISNFSDMSLDKLKPKWRRVVRTLLDYDPSLMTYISTNTPATYRIKLDDIFNIIPMSRKEVDKYNGLVKQMKLLGINLIIESDFWGSNKSIFKQAMGS